MAYSLATAIEQESLLLEAVMLLLTRHSDVRCAEVRDRGESRAVARARGYIEAHFAHDLSLKKVAESVCLSPFHFARLFAKVAGMLPHAYLESVRIRNPCALLAQGESIASVAASVSCTSLRGPRQMRVLRKPQDCPISRVSGPMKAVIVNPYTTWQRWPVS